MTSDPSNFSLPRGITEADVIDLADGTLPRNREAEVLAALKKHPQLGLLAKQLRSDQSLVAGLGEVRAPRGLADGIEARLEAAVLRDLAAQSVEVVRPIPISTVQVREPSVLRLLLESPWSRRFATAASIAIVFGLGAYAVRTVLNAMPAKQIAHTTPVPMPLPETITPPAHPTTEVAVTTPDHNEPVTPVAVASAGTPVSDDLTETKLARFAAEGRLAITVHTSVASGTLKRLDAFAKARDTGWHSVALDAPTQYAALLTPQADAPVIKTSPHDPSPTAIAGDSSHTSSPSGPTGTSAPGLPAVHPVVKGIYTVELTPGEQAFRSLVRSITDTLPDGARVSYRVLPEPIAAPVALDPDSVLWWTSPAGKWSKLAHVPVVVQSLE